MAIIVTGFISSEHLLRASKSPEWGMTRNARLRFWASPQGLPLPAGLWSCESPSSQRKFLGQAVRPMSCYKNTTQSLKSSRLFPVVHISSVEVRRDTRPLFSLTKNKHKCKPPPSLKRPMKMQRWWWNSRDAKVKTAYVELTLERKEEQENLLLGTSN